MELEELAIHLLVGFPIALLYVNAVEWTVHRYALHGLGKNRDSMWAFHWHDHHRASRQNDMIDPDYEGQAFISLDNREAISLVSVTLIHLPLLWVAPGFVLGVAYGAMNYWRVHKRSHLDPEWARENLPWHVDHHMGPNQDANWCVTRPWFDHIMGTRIAYVGTEREAKDREKAAARAARAVRVAAGN